MKKILILMILVLVMFTLTACQNKAQTLTLYLRPSQDSKQALEAIEPLERLLLEALKNEGLNYERVIVKVGSNEPVIYETLKSGMADVAMINFGEYLRDIALLEDTNHLVPILLSTRGALNKTSEHAIDWNNLEPIIRDDSVQTHYQRGIMIAGPSPHGRYLANLINTNQPITWEDINQAHVCINNFNRTPTVFISYRFYELYGKTLTDLDNYTIIENNALRMAALASEHCDVIQTAGIDQNRYQPQWNDPQGFARTESIYHETDIIYVTGQRLNDGVLINNTHLNSAAVQAIQNAFIALIQSDAGKALFGMYNIGGFKVVEEGDFDDEIEVQRFLLINE